MDNTMVDCFFLTHSVVVICSNHVSSILYRFRNITNELAAGAVTNGRKLPPVYREIRENRSYT